MTSRVTHDCLGTVPLSPALAVDFKGNLFPVDFYFDFSSPFTYIAATRVNRYFGQQNVKWIPMVSVSTLKCLNGSGQGLLQSTLGNQCLTGTKDWRDPLRKETSLSHPGTSIRSS